MALTTKAQGNPAAGAEVLVTVPSATWWRVFAIHFKLVTSATVANRLARLILDDGTNIFCKLPNDVNHAASQTTEYSYGLAASFEAAQGATVPARIYPLPAVVLGPNYRIRTLTAAIQVGDQYSEIALLVEEYGADPTLIRFGDSGQIVA